MFMYIYIYIYVFIYLYIFRIYVDIFWPIAPKNFENVYDILMF